MCILEVINVVFLRHSEAGKKLFSLIALSLNLDQHFFEKIGAIDKPSAFLRLLRYPGSFLTYISLSQPLPVTLIIYTASHMFVNLLQRTSAFGSTFIYLS